MTVLVHEVWKDRDGLPGVCLAGAMGNGFRELLGPDAELVATIEASSHFEAMTKYYTLMGWGTYTTDSLLDHQPYPTDWRSIQLNS